MPIREADPWRLQYFQDEPCPDDVFVATDDPDACRYCAYSDGCRERPPVRQERFAR